MLLTFNPVWVYVRTKIISVFCIKKKKPKVLMSYMIAFQSDFKSLLASMSNKIQSNKI